MKRLISLVLLALSVLILSCNSDDGTPTPNNDLQGFNSQICDNAQGPAAAYWDFAHSLPVPLTSVPVIRNPGAQFIHSQFPLLGFIIPQGFTPFEITDPQTGTIGVDVVRNDNNVVFRWIPNTQAPGQISSRSIIANEINALLAFFEFNGTPDVICTTSANTVFETIPSEFNARLLQFGGMTAQVWVRSSFIAGGTFSAISITAAPTAEYNTQVLDTFLPINFQLFVGNDGDIVDQDGDGFTILEDPDDQDPNVP